MYFNIRNLVGMDVANGEKYFKITVPSFWKGNSYKTMTADELKENIKENGLVVSDPEDKVMNSYTTRVKYDKIHAIVNCALEYLCTFEEKIGLEVRPFNEILSSVNLLFVDDSDPSLPIDTMATNGNSIYINPSFVWILEKIGIIYNREHGNSDIDDGVGGRSIGIVYVLAHEVFHILHDDINSTSTSSSKYTNGHLINVCQDYRCNYSVEEFFDEMKDFHEYAAGWYDDVYGTQYWEKTYDELIKNPRKRNNPRKFEDDPKTVPGGDGQNPQNNGDADYKRGFSDVYNEIKTVIGSLSMTDVASRKRAIDTIIGTYRDVILAKTGVDIALSESVKTNMPYGNSSYNDGVIAAIDQILDELNTPMKPQGGDGGSCGGGKSIYDDMDSDGSSDDQNQEVDDSKLRDAINKAKGAIDKLDKVMSDAQGGQQNQSQMSDAVNSASNAATECGDNAMQMAKDSANAAKANGGKQGQQGQQGNQSGSQSGSQGGSRQGGQQGGQQSGNQSNGNGGSQSGSQGSSQGSQGQQSGQQSGGSRGGGKMISDGLAVDRMASDIKRACDEIGEMISDGNLDGAKAAMEALKSKMGDIVKKCENMLGENCDDGEGEGDGGDQNRWNGQQREEHGNVEPGKGADTSMRRLTDTEIATLLDKKHGVSGGANGVETKKERLDRWNREIERSRDGKKFHYAKTHATDGDSANNFIKLKIKSLCSDDWQDIMLDHMKSHVSITTDTLPTSEDERFDPDVAEYFDEIGGEIQSIKHITIILDTSGSVMGVKDAYAKLLTEINNALSEADSLNEGRVAIIVDFIYFGSSTDIKRFMFDPNENKFPPFYDGGGTDYVGSFAWADILVHKPDDWDEISSAEGIRSVNELKKRVADFDLEYDVVPKSEVTLVFTDTDFVCGSKYYGGFFDDSDFIDDMYVFIIMDGKTTDRSGRDVVDPTSTNGALKFNQQDKRTGWNLILVDRDSLMNGVTVNKMFESELPVRHFDIEDDDEDDAVYTAARKEVTHNEKKATHVADVTYRGNTIIHGGGTLENICVTEMGPDGILHIKPLNADGIIPASAFERMATIDEKNYVVDGGIMYITTKLSDKKILENVPSACVNGGRLVFKDCKELKPTTYETIKESLGKSCAYVNCKAIVEYMSGVLTDMPILSVPYVDTYISKIMPKLLGRKFTYELRVCDGAMYSEVSTSDYADPEYWDDRFEVGVYIKYNGRVRGRGEYVDADVIKNELRNSGYGYIGFPDYIKFCGSDYPIILNYKQDGPAQRTLKGSMAEHNRLKYDMSNPIEVVSADEMRYPGIYLFGATGKLYKFC